MEGKNKKKRILIFMVLLILGFILLSLIMLIKDYSEETCQQPTGEIMTREEFGNWLIPYGVQLPDRDEAIAYVTFAECRDAFERLGMDETIFQKSIEHTYQEQHAVLKEDCLSLYQQVLKKKSQKETEQGYLVVESKSYFILGTHHELDLEKSSLDAMSAFFYTEQGMISYKPEQMAGSLKHIVIEEPIEKKGSMEEIQEDFFQMDGQYYPVVRTEQKVEEIRFYQMDCFVWQNQIIDILQVKEADYCLKNVFIVDPETGSVFVDGVYMMLPTAFFPEDCREQVTDVVIQKSQLQTLHPKKNKIGGKLLRKEQAGVEVEGYGFFPFSADCKTYDLIGELGDSTVQDCIIGYAFTDFVLEKGEIQACLIARKETMENIRVLLRGPEYEGRFYEEVTFVPDTELSLQKTDGIEITLPANEETVLLAADYAVGERLQMKSDVLSKRTKILEVKRAQGNASYRGDFELFRAEDGFVIINELPLEEYLYAVVPSEMPASYPMSALQAQAICARTYAYMNMLHAGISQFGAHVDDSAAFQVYQNSAEFDSTCQAVKNTKGQFLFYEDRPAQTYYYSTSCGFGTNVSVWNGTNVEEYAYMEPQRISAKVSDEDSKWRTPEALQDNDVFDAFIRTNDGVDFEREEGWYRWTYSVSEVNEETIQERLQYRYETNPSLVLTQIADGSYSTEELGKVGKIKNIEITERLPGGVASVCVITGEKSTVKILTELVIRSVLCDGDTQVIRQNGSAVNAKSLLPSGFFSIELQKDGENGSSDENVLKYILYGGGYGHGVGMSQNGARAMANLGYTTEEILRFFYHNTEIRQE